MTYPFFFLIMIFQQKNPFKASHTHTQKWPLIIDVGSEPLEGTGTPGLRSDNSNSSCVSRAAKEEERFFPPVAEYDIHT